MGGQDHEGTGRPLPPPVPGQADRDHDLAPPLPQERDPLQEDTVDQDLVAAGAPQLCAALLGAIGRD